MLYDNAQLLELLALCHAQSAGALYWRRALETVGWLRREMLAPGGAFCASLDADSEGAEGRFYVWTFDEIVATLGEEDARFLGAFYDASPEGNWHDESRGENVIILNRLRSPAAAPEEEARLAALCEKLRLAREGRPHPGLDDKIMADWNGLMIAALVKAALAFDEREWIALAARAYDFIVETCEFLDAEGRRRLAHGWRADVLVSPGLALDHAAMIGAALALHEARNWRAPKSSHQDYLADALAWAQALETYHRDPETGLLCMAARDAQDLILRLSPPRPTTPFPMRTGSIFPLSFVSPRTLATIVGGPAPTRSSPRLLPPWRQNFFGHLACLNALEFTLRAKTVVTIGPERQELLKRRFAFLSSTASWWMRTARARRAWSRRRNGKRSGRERPRLLSRGETAPFPFGTKRDCAQPSGTSTPQGPERRSVLTFQELFGLAESCSTDRTSSA